MTATRTGARASPLARAVLFAHGFMAVVSLLLLVAFLPALGAPRVPVLYRLMYGDIRWALFALDFYAVPALFVAMVFVLTGPTRRGLKDAMRSSVGYKRALVWSWVLMLGAWFLVLAVATGGRA